VVYFLGHPVCNKHNRWNGLTVACSIILLQKKIEIVYLESIGNYKMARISISINGKNNSLSRNNVG